MTQRTPYVLREHIHRNAGFNCAEAVNFGPPDWLPFGSDRAQKYRDDAKPLTLSHDALLVTLVSVALQVPLRSFICITLATYCSCKPSVSRRAAPPAAARTVAVSSFFKASSPGLAGAIGAARAGRGGRGGSQPCAGEGSLRRASAGGNLLNLHVEIEAPPWLSASVSSCMVIVLA